MNLCHIRQHNALQLRPRLLLKQPIELLKLNNELAELLDLDKDFLLSENGTMFLGGQALPETTRSISLAYAGHQFGQLVPQLGDGRALLLGDKICKDNQRRDIQLKGSGKTMFSRGGDGRAGMRCSWLQFWLMK